MRKLLLIPILILLAVPLSADNIPTTFYVNSVLGSDNAITNTGTATDNAWATVAKVNAFSRTNLKTRSDIGAFGSEWTVDRLTASEDNGEVPGEPDVPIVPDMALGR